MRVIPISLFMVVAFLTATTPIQAKSKLEQALEFASLFGFVSGTANKCPNLTLAKIPKVREAIRVYWRSDTPAVRKKFHESRRIAIAGVRKDKKKTCDFMAKTMPWMFEETRDR